jgi:hypothetical protein
MIFLTLGQGSPNVFREEPDSKYFRLCGTRGFGKIKDIHNISTSFNIANDDRFLHFISPYLKNRFK